MILDIDNFIRKEEAYWKELESFFRTINDSDTLSLEQVKRFHYLYERTSEDLVKVQTLSGEHILREYLESLIARSYTIIHRNNKKKSQLNVMQWFFCTLPRTFRGNIKAFYLSLAITLAGALFGGIAVSTEDDVAKHAIFPNQFSHLFQSPDDRVAEEESRTNNPVSKQHSSFATYLMQNNIKVSILTLGLGMTLGVGTILLLFYNGVILGAVAIDYILTGNTVFLFGWLLPHGVIEIPAVLIAGQAGLILGNCILRSRSKNKSHHFRSKIKEIATLAGGFSIMLIWAGIVESFISQYHEPVLPYYIKISFGIIELLLLLAFFGYSGRKKVEVIE